MSALKHVPLMGWNRGRKALWEGRDLSRTSPSLLGLAPNSGLIYPQVSFQHEVYPEESAIAGGLDQELDERPLSRQVLIVQELEIRDRLATSKINKFLHLHTSERLPRRTHSNMVRMHLGVGSVFPIVSLKVRLEDRGDGSQE